MAKQEEKEPITNLKEIKEIIFKIVSDELDGYISAAEKLKEAMAEIQRQRYSSSYQIVGELGWSDEFLSYRKSAQKERTMTKK